MTSARKRTLVTILGFIAGALVVAVVLLIRQQAPALRLAFLGCSNGVARFQAHNGHDVCIYYRTLVEVKTVNGWPTYPKGLALPHPAPDIVLNPKMSTQIKAFQPTGLATWRLSVIYYREDTWRERALFAIARFFSYTGIESLARRVPLEKKGYEVLSGAITNCEELPKI